MEKVIESVDLQKYKIFVRYKDGAFYYDMSERAFYDLAHKAHAMYKINKISLVNCDILDEYLFYFQETSQKSYTKPDSFLPKKKYVRYKTGSDLYSVSERTLREWAKKAEATIKIDGIALVNVDTLNRYLERFRVS